MTPGNQRSCPVSKSLTGPVTLLCAAREARCVLYAVVARLEINDIQGEEQPYIEDCLEAIAMLEEVLL